MRTLDDKVALARQCLAFCGRAGARRRAADRAARGRRHEPRCAPAPIVPVKALDRAKRRLSSVLPDAGAPAAGADDAGGRARPRVAGVESDRRRGCRHARRPRGGAGARAVAPPSCASPAPGSSMRRSRAGIAYASARGAGQALVLPADVPLATPDELRSLIAVARRPARRDAGAVARRRRHQRAAARPARCHRALLRARQLSAASVAGHGAARRRQRRAPCRALPATSTSRPTWPCWLPPRQASERYAFLAAASGGRLH